jgi:predicted 3-demethylubiquinone-9 3-methyltransferase (glyoxalase superfamily)
MDSNREQPFTFTPSISLFVHCETEGEIDGLFEKLSDGGKVLMPLENIRSMRNLGGSRTNLGCPGS